ncbi:hypothetical protein ACFL6P_01430 [Candidatus Latescibacterota bacterium]
MKVSDKGSYHLSKELRTYLEYHGMYACSAWYHPLKQDKIE